LLALRRLPILGLPIQGLLRLDLPGIGVTGIRDDDNDG
jgi:hypothetical protein